MRVRFWGTRGSIATPGSTTLKYGGNTSCVELVTNSGHRFILDCGTGARALGLDLLRNSPKPIRATLLLGHTHWDHIQGFPFFMPAFEAGNEFTVCAPQGNGRPISEVLSGQMEFTYFPVELDQLPAHIEFRELGEGVFDFGKDKVYTQHLHHPAPAIAYRIEADGVIVVYMCDHEPFGEQLWHHGAAPGLLDSIFHDADRRHAAFMRHADLVIHDAQYTPQEYPEKRNWGHSTYEYAVELAAMSDVYRLVLTHHDPTHDDAFLDEVQHRARKLARRRNFMMQVMCAYEGMEVHVVGPQTDRIRTIDTVLSAPIPAAKINAVVVCDDADLRPLIVEALKNDEFEILASANADAALRQLHDGEADILILDLTSRSDGLELLKRLRSRHATARVPALVVTSHGDEPVIKALDDGGATGHLVKPFTPSQLCARVRACIGRARLAAAAAAV